MGYVQHKLRASTAFSCQKSAHLDRRSRLQPGQRLGDFPDPHALDFALHAPVHAGFIARGFVPQPQTHQWQSGGRVAQRFQAGDGSCKFDRVGLHTYAAGAAGAAAGAATAGLAISSTGVARDFSSRIIGDGLVTASLMDTIR
jgi:hypothetical protein